MRAHTPPAGDYLGLDIGSSHVASAILRLPEKKLLALESIPISARLPSQRPGEHQQDTHILLAAARQLLAKSKSTRLRAIGLTGQMHGILYLDENYLPLSALLNWQDSRGDWIEEPRPLLLRESANGYGLLTHWVNHKLGLVPPRTRWLVDAASYVGMHLATKKHAPVLHPSMAASWGGYQQGAGDFDRIAVAQIGLDPHSIPQVSTDGLLGSDVGGVPISTALGDNQAGVLAALEMAPNPRDTPPEQTILASFGTSAQISCINDQHLDIPSGGAIEQRPFVDETYLVAGSALCGGSAYSLLAEFVADLWQRLSAHLQHRTSTPIPQPSQEDLFSFLNRLEIIEDGGLPSFTPFFLGQRQQPHIRAQIGALDTENFRLSHLKEALLRGMIAELHDYYRQLCAIWPREDQRLVGMGNGLRRNLRLQHLLERDFGLPLQLMEQHEEAAIGAALHGARSIG